VGRADVQLRAATAADVDAVATIWHDGWRDGHLSSASPELIAARTPASFRERVVERLGPVTTVATVDGEIAGFVMVVDDEVEQVYVAASHRGGRVAGVLLAAAEQQVHAGGHDVAWLAVVADNARARRFYEREGWSDAGPFDYAAAGGVTVRAHRYEKRL
jgi:GNAT superfamily N-acetyltransferase